MSNLEILKRVVSGELTTEEADKLLSAAATSGANVTMKVSEKGCVTFRGLPGANVRYGFSPRRETLEWLYANKAKVEAFLKQNSKEITKRSDASREARKAA